MILKSGNTVWNIESVLPMVFYKKGGFFIKLVVKGETLDLKKIGSPQLKD